MKAILILVFTLIVCNTSAQNVQMYFIGEKIEEEYHQFDVIKKKEVMDDGTIEEVVSRPKWCRGYYYSKYKIIKLLKGKCDYDTIEFYSYYCSEFGYRKPVKSKYAIIGLIQNEGKWYKSYIEKIYNVKNKFILPYKTDYPFINYGKISPAKLEKFQRIKINISDAYSETQYVSDYPTPYYLMEGNFAISKYGFIL